MNQKKHLHHSNNSIEGMSGSKLLWVTILNLSITIVQVIGGLVSNSLSLLSDAIHNLGDSSAIFIAFLAGKCSKKSADESHTFGYKRIEILAAFFNAMVLIAICLFLFIEALRRFMDPQPIKGLMMFIVAAFGLLANLISVLLLNKDKSYNLNVRAAYLHLLGDTMSSVAVILGGIAIWQFNVFWIDPLITVLVGIYIIYHTWNILKETVDILMQSTPENINIKEIKTEVEKISGVNDVHHIHIWKLDDIHIHLETHVNVENNVNMKEMMKIKSEIENILHTKFNISHTTLQMEFISKDAKRDLIGN